jgi:hypothetical protein
MAFRVTAAQCKKICPERLNWLGRLAGWVLRVFYYLSVVLKFTNGDNFE